MNYQTYLFSCLLKIYDKEFDAKPYDEQYDLLPFMYEQFHLSVYNDDDTNLYDCIVLYLNHKYGSQ
jgi:hypothetical protein